jgi:secreted trypsin-like serine protease
VPPAECRCKTIQTRSVRRVQTKIVGGGLAHWGSVPFAVPLSENGRSSYCGGAIIGPRTILTAAHCLPDVGHQALLWPGYDPASLQEGKPAVITRACIHPDYAPERNYYADSAVVWLSEDVQIPPVALATEDPTLGLPVKVRAVGWGLTAEGGFDSSFLREVEVDVWLQSDCEKVYGPLFTHLCAGVPEGGKDTCQGDSGGPLLIQVMGQWVLVATTSFGDGCARPGFPGVYTAVYKPIIREFINPCVQ